MKKQHIQLILIFGLLFIGGQALAQGSLTDLPAHPSSNADIETYLEWVFKFGIAVGYTAVLVAFVISGALFSGAFGSPAIQGKAKEWLQGAISGLIIFTFLYFILATVNPKLAFFRIGKPIDYTLSPEDENAPAGVYFYETADCTGEFHYLPIGRANNLQFPAVMRSMKVINEKDGGAGQELWVGIYDGADFMRKCRGNYGSSCQPTTLDSSRILSTIVARREQGSAKITFYRNPTHTEDGGWVTLSPGYYRLAEVYFDGKGGGKSSNSDQCTVPEDQQDCVEWDTLGKCKKRQCPSLFENIASLKIEDKAVVILGYTKQPGKLPIEFCQTYPIQNDKNQIGPKQVKWDTINSFPGIFPNELYIIDTKE